MAKRPFITSALLTAVAIAYRNPASSLIHQRALPRLEVLSESFKYNVFPITEAFTLPELEVGRKGQPSQIEFTADEVESSTKDYGLDDAIPQSDITEAAKARAEKRSMFDPRASAVEGLTNLIELGREVRTAKVVQDPDNFPAAQKIALVGTDKFSDYANSDPYGVIDEGMDKTLVYRPNHIVMGQPVWSKAKRHPKLIKAVKGGLSEDGAITKAQFAELFEIDIDNLLIGMAQVNLAKKGQAVSLSRVWGNSIQLLYLDMTKQSTTDAVMTWGFSAELGTRISGSIEDPDIGLHGGERIRVGEQVREHVCAKALGYQISGAI